MSVPTAIEQKYLRHIQANWFALFVKPILSLRYRPGRCGSPRERALAADDLAVFHHALHADNTRVDRGNPAIAVLFIGYRPLGSCSRAAGWSRATLCPGPTRTKGDVRLRTAVRGLADIKRALIDSVPI
jgi:hypothetical protein